MMLNRRTLRPAAFLDRDGVINVDSGYTSRPEDLVFTPTAVEGIRLLNKSGYLVIVVTNQSGVARGYYASEDVDRFHEAIAAELARSDASIDAFYYCPYHPDGTVDGFSCEHDDRKPSPGMLRRATEDWAIDLDRSFLIGDKESDVVAAARMGIPGIRVTADICDLAAVLRKLIAVQEGTSPSVDDKSARGIRPGEVE
jgi:D-glycero-D-manno-heptose 1,7-bisphosphate phosphatase